MPSLFILTMEITMTEFDSLGRPGVTKEPEVAPTHDYAGRPLKPEYETEAYKIAKARKDEAKGDVEKQVAAKENQSAGEKIRVEVEVGNLSSDEAKKTITDILKNKAADDLTKLVDGTINPVDAATLADAKTLATKEVAKPKKTKAKAKKVT